VRKPIKEKRAAKKHGASGAVNGVIPAPIDLDDTLEWEAHASMLERLGLRNAAGAALRHR